MALSNAGSLTDAQARTLVTKSLRLARAAYRAADTAGEREERELDRLIKRKTRMNANQLATLNKRYLEFFAKATAIQTSLRNANEIASNF
jgi:hypothetical protein